MIGTLRTATRGALAGAVASVAMSAPMLAASRSGAISKPPPEHITQRLLTRTGLRRHTDEEQEDALTAVNHVAFGAGSGVLYSLLARRLPRAVPPVLAGVAFGLGVYTVSYAGWLPALGLMPPADRDEPGRQPLMIAAHVVYGAVLGVLVGRPSARGS